jgi:hypothetical protein
MAEVCRTNQLVGTKSVYLVRARAASEETFEIKWHMNLTIQERTTLVWASPTKLFRSNRIHVPRLTRGARKLRPVLYWNHYQVL